MHLLFLVFLGVYVRLCSSSEKGNSIMELTGALLTEDFEILAWRSKGLSDGEIAEKIVAARKEEAARKEKEAEAERNFKIMMNLPEGERLQWLKMQKGKIYAASSEHPLIFFILTYIKQHTFFQMKMKVRVLQVFMYSI
jgi:hypothetical protein